MSSHSPGLNCPSCKFPIKFTYEMLLHDSKISCPNCGLKMDMQVPTEMKQHIQEIHLAEKLVEKAKNFKK